MTGARFFIAGGAGFIGSHFTDRLLCDKTVEAVTLYDNFTSGRQWHYAHHEQDRRLHVLCADVKDMAALVHSNAASPASLKRHPIDLHRTKTLRIGPHSA